MGIVAIPSFPRRISVVPRDVAKGSLPNYASWFGALDDATLLYLDSGLDSHKKEDLLLCLQWAQQIVDKKGTDPNLVYLCWYDNLKTCLEELGWRTQHLSPRTVHPRHSGDRVIDMVKQSIGSATDISEPIRRSLIRTARSLHGPRTGNSTALAAFNSAAIDSKHRHLATFQIAAAALAPNNVDVQVVLWSFQFCSSEPITDVLGASNSGGLLLGGHVTLTLDETVYDFIREIVKQKTCPWTSTYVRQIHL